MCITGNTGILVGSIRKHGFPGEISLKTTIGYMDVWRNGAVNYRDLNLLYKWVLGFFRYTEKFEKYGIPCQIIFEDSEKDAMKKGVSVE